MHESDLQNEKKKKSFFFPFADFIIAKSANRNSAIYLRSNMRLQGGVKRPILQYDFILARVPVLSVLPLALFAPPGHLGLVARFSSRSNLDRSVLQSSGLEGHLVATLSQKNKIK